MNSRSEQSALLAETVATQLLDMENSGLLKSESERLERDEWPRQLWEQLEENGLTSIFVPESEGGFGGGWEDAGIVLFLAGFHSLPAPFPETILARMLLSRAGVDAPPGALAIACADQVRLERQASAAGDSTARQRASFGAGWWNTSWSLGAGGAYRLALVHQSAIEPISNRHSIAREPVADLCFRTRKRSPSLP
jgi:hypothetical protein